MTRPTADTLLPTIHYIWSFIGSGSSGQRRLLQAPSPATAAQSPAVTAAVGASRNVTTTCRSYLSRSDNGEPSRDSTFITTCRALFAQLLDRMNHKGFICGCLALQAQTSTWQPLPIGPGSHRSRPFDMATLLRTPQRMPVKLDKYPLLSLQQVKPKLKCWRRCVLLRRKLKVEACQSCDVKLRPTSPASLQPVRFIFRTPSHATLSKLLLHKRRGSRAGESKACSGKAVLQSCTLAIGSLNIIQI